MKVSKFGGSSLCDAEHIRKVGQILSSDPSRVVAVVSAPGKRYSDDIKITDMLYTCQSLVAKGGSCEKEFAIIRDRFTEIAKDLGVSHNITEALDEVYVNISNGASAHYAASRGEYLNAVLISQYLGREMIDAQDVVFITDEGTVEEKTYDAVASVLEEGKQYVFPGFFGQGSDGKVRAFSRGGSDISGAIVARALGNKASDGCIYENWTDVSGISKADPRVVHDAKVIKEMTYREVRELAAVGFNVFHEDAIAPVREAGIPIQVKNTGRPEDEGTAIVASRDVEQDPIIGISVKKDYVRIGVHKVFLLKNPQARIRIEQDLRDAGLALEFALQGIDDLTWYAQIHAGAEPDLASLADALRKEYSLETVSIEPGYAVTAVAGEGLKSQKKRLSHILPALMDEGVEVTFTLFDATPLTALFGVRESDAKTVIHTVYDAMFR